jgi:hypothetical protein
LSTDIYQHIKRPWWRRVNPTIVALVIAIGAVAVIGWHSNDASRKSVPAASEHAAAAPRPTFQPRDLVGALSRRHHRRQRAHIKKKASPPARASQSQSGRP